MFIHLKYWLIKVHRDPCLIQGTSQSFQSKYFWLIWHSTLQVNLNTNFALLSHRVIWLLFTAPACLNAIILSLFMQGPHHQKRGLLTDFFFFQSPNLLNMAWPKKKCSPTIIKQFFRLPELREPILVSWNIDNDVRRNVVWDFRTYRFLKSSDSPCLHSSLLLFLLTIIATLQ